MLVALTALITALAAMQPLPQFVLRNTAGATHDQNDWRSSRAVVLFFTTIDCPLSNGYIPEMNRIRADYAKRGVSFYAVQTDTTVPDGEVRKHAKEFGFFLSYPHGNTSNTAFEPWHWHYEGQ